MAAVVGLLFFAFAYFALGQADLSRNGTQTAADAAALAAAQKSRDELNLADFLDQLEDLFGGQVVGRADGCDEAARFAGQNGAQLTGSGCNTLGDGRWGFRVEVQSVQPMGDNIIDGTENEHARATATAVVEPRCGFEANEPPSPSPSPTEPPPSTGEPSPPPGDGEDEEEPPSPGTITCEDGTWEIDPEDLDALPDLADLFTVRLAED